jgi:hypothetical protein
VLGLVVSCATPRPAPRSTPRPTPVSRAPGGLPDVSVPPPEMSIGGGYKRRVGCPTTFGGDTLGAHFTARQVEAPAKLLPGSLLAPSRATILVSFDVDTAGRPVLATLRTSSEPVSASELAAIERVVERMRYSAAQFDGCRVRQEVEAFVPRPIDP